MSNVPGLLDARRSDRRALWLPALLAALLAVAGGLVLAFGGWLAGVALVVGGVGALLVLRDIELGYIGVIAVITLLPFATLPVDIGITPTFLDLALAAVIGVWLVRLVTGRQRRIVTAPVALPIVLFLIVSIFAFIFGLQNGPLTSTLARKFAELLLSIGFVIVIVDSCRDWARIERIVRALLLGGAAASALAVGLWLLPDETANQVLNALVRLEYPGGWVIRYIEENPALAERAIGTSVDPNVLGGLLVLIGALAVPQLTAPQPLLRRRYTVAVVGIIGLAILLTFSRGALLSLGVGVFFLALVRYRRWLIVMAGGVVGLVLVLVTGVYRFVPLVDTYFERLVAGLSFLDFYNTDLASQMRLGEIRDAWLLIQRYPVFGVGFAGSPDIDLYLGVANVYLSIAQQMGLLGLVAFLAIMATLFGHAFAYRHHFRRDARRDPVWLGLHAAVAGGLATGLFDHYLFNTQFHHAVTAFWLMVGLAAAATRLTAVDATAAGRARPTSTDR